VEHVSPELYQALTTVRDLAGTRDPEQALELGKQLVLAKDELPRGDWGRFLKAVSPWDNAAEWARRQMKAWLQSPEALSSVEEVVLPEIVDGYRERLEWILQAGKGTRERGRRTRQVLKVYSEAPHNGEWPGGYLRPAVRPQTLARHLEAMAEQGAAALLHGSKGVAKGSTLPGYAAHLWKVMVVHPVRKPLHSAELIRVEFVGEEGEDGTSRGPIHRIVDTETGEELADTALLAGKLHGMPLKQARQLFIDAYFPELGSVGEGAFRRLMGEIHPTMFMSPKRKRAAMDPAGSAAFPGLNYQWNLDWSVADFNCKQYLSGGGMRAFRPYKSVIWEPFASVPMAIRYSLEPPCKYATRSAMLMAFYPQSATSPENPIVPVGTRLPGRHWMMSGFPEVIRTDLGEVPRSDWWQRLPRASERVIGKQLVLQDTKIGYTPTRNAPAESGIGIVHKQFEACFLRFHPKFKVAYTGRSPEHRPDYFDRSAGPLWVDRNDPAWMEQLPTLRDVEHLVAMWVDRFLQTEPAGRPEETRLGMPRGTFWAVKAAQEPERVRVPAMADAVAMLMDEFPKPKPVAVAEGGGIVHALNDKYWAGELYSWAGAHVKVRYDLGDVRFVHCFDPARDSFVCTARRREVFAVDEPEDVRAQARRKAEARQRQREAEAWIQTGLDKPGLVDDLVGRIEAGAAPSQSRLGLVGRETRPVGPADELPRIGAPVEEIEHEPEEMMIDAAGNRV